MVRNLLLLIFLIPLSVQASVLASLDADSVELGEMVTYSLNVSGEDIKRPNIQRICDTDVISTSSQTSINMINGNINRSYILSYKFIPQKSCLIKATEVEVAGKIQKSNEVSLKVGAPQTSKDKNFLLELSLDKKDVYVGETFNLTLLFKSKDGSRAVDSEFIAPVLKGFWVKGESKPQNYREGSYNVQKIVYTLAAQREGSLELNKAQMRIAFRSKGRDSWGAWAPRIKWKTYFSNSLTLNVKAPPAGVNLVGNFKIIADVDKKEINSNEAVNLRIKVVGDGNLEDIKSFKPNSTLANVFDEKIKISGNTLVQKMAFVSDEDFVIPAFSLKFFNPKTKEVKTISTEEVNIKVKSAKAKEELTIKRQELTKKEEEPILSTPSISNIDMSTALIAEVFSLGLILGLSFMYFKPWLIFKREKRVSIKDEKTLLVKLLPYKDDAEVKKVLEIIESNLYTKDKQKIDKKVLQELIKKYKIL